MRIAQSDPSRGQIAFEFDVLYLREFHHLPQSSRFVFKFVGVSSFRASLNKQEVEKSWMEAAKIFETGDCQVSDAEFTQNSDGIGFKVGLLLNGGADFQTFHVDAESFALEDVDENPIELADFIRLGEAYWDDFEHRKE